MTTPAGATPTIRAETEATAPAVEDQEDQAAQQLLAEAAGQDDGDQDSDRDSDAHTDPEGAEQLGDAGKRALDAMKAKWRSERDKRRELERRLAPQPPADRNNDAPEPDQLRRDAERAATAKANARILRSEVKAAAAGRLADPRDALKLLDLERFEVGEDGEVDEEEIADAIGELLKAKPYLAAQSGRRFQGTGDGGARRTQAPPSLDEQIARAEQAGDWAVARRLKAAKLTQSHHQ